MPSTDFMTPARLLFLISVFLPLFLRADTIDTVASIDSAPIVNSSYTTICSQNTTSGAMCETTFSSPYAGDAMADAQGSLSSGYVGAETRFDMGNSSTLGISAATASLSYDFTVLNGPASGNLLISGVVDGNALVDPACGSFSTAAGGLCSTDAYADLLITGGESYIDSPAGLTNGAIQLIPNGSTDFQIEVPYDDAAASFFVELQSFASCQAETTMSGTCSAASNYLDTLQITGASVLDSNDAVVPGASISDDSGFNPNAATTPEPSSLLLLSGGLLALLRRGAFQKVHRMATASYRAWANRRK